jgi:hyperosmotically inducible protein
MKKPALLSIAMASLLAISSVAFADDMDVDRSHPKAFVKDSAITTKIKTKLAAEHITSLGRIRVDTDADGIVWLSGTARTPEAIERAESLARETDGVRGVKNHLTVRADD